MDENTYCYTLEVSFFSYQPVGFSHPIPYTEEECKYLTYPKIKCSSIIQRFILKDMKLGRNLARTFLDYYKLQNFIVFNPSTGIIPKINNQSYLNYKTPAQTQSNGNMSSNSIYGSNTNLNAAANSYSGSTSNMNIANTSFAILNSNKNSKKSPTSNTALKPLSSLSITANSTSSLSNNSNNLNQQSEPNANVASLSQSTNNKKPKFFIENGFDYNQ